MLPATVLGKCDWAFIAKEIDQVVYLAGGVDLSLPLEDLKPLNLTPLSTLLKLRKPIHYASTLAVPLCTECDGTVFGGYAQSKVLAEERLAPHPGVTLRYGHLVGPPRGDELLAIVLRGLMDLSCCPTHSDAALCFDWTPMEWAADKTIELLDVYQNRLETSVRRGWHFHLNDLGCILHQEKGLELVSAGEFHGRPALTREAKLAQLALWKCGGRRPANQAFDLFLLGNSQELLERSETAPLNQLSSYVECALNSVTPV